MVRAVFRRCANVSQEINEDTIKITENCFESISLDKTDFKHACQSCKNEKIKW